MARPRIQLHSLLVAITSNVYFQPPSSVQMAYPCIVYERDGAETKYADNHPYHNTRRYSITIIDRDPDSLIPDAVALLPLCSFNRFFTADNLNHDVYILYF